LSHQAFDALTLLFEQQEGRLACEKNSYKLSVGMLMMVI